MKPSIFVALLFAAASLFAQDAKSPLLASARVVAQPDLTHELGSDWKSPYGIWEIKNGEMIISELPENKHAAVLWHKIPLQKAIIECEFMFDGGFGFLIGCDATNRHIGRLVITSNSAKISEDSSEVKGKQPGKTLAEVALDLKPGQYYPVRFEWAGDKMSARVAGKEILGEHPSLDVAKVQWWFAVSGAKVRVKNIKVSEGR